MIQVIKLGGSLLDLPDLIAKLRRFVEDQAKASRFLILVGGGQVVDAIRHYDRIFAFEDSFSHWLCVDLMHVTAQLLQAQFPEWPLLSDAASLDEFTKGSGPTPTSNPIENRVAIVSPKAFYSRQFNAESLPIGWQTTSDSISALLARIVEADQLIVLKSTDHAMEGEPLLDASFANAVSDRIKLRIVNLRAY